METRWQIKTVGVLGCGLMGAGIAQVSRGGRLQDDRPRGRTTTSLNKGLGRIEKFLDDGVAKGKVTAEDARHDARRTCPARRRSTT